jgi:succinoglycan biosynthesis protein ExoV
VGRLGNGGQPRQGAGDGVILFYWRGGVTNFGDELNTLLWPALLPHFFDDNPASRFLGIGSILDRRHDGPSLKLVAGSGYGGYEGRPRLDETWSIHWVRGPRTARLLGLDPALGLGDPAALVPAALGIRRHAGTDIGFMPHFESAGRGAWCQAAALAGIRLIDPRDPPAAVLSAMAGCRLIMSEALHGIIVADALRIPWIAIRPLARIHRPKWFDWADTLGISPRFTRLPASTGREWMETGPLGTSPIMRLWRGPDDRPDSISNRTHRAAAALRRLTAADPQLSREADLDRCQSRQRDALIRLRHVPVAAAPLAAFRPAPLREDIEAGCRMPVVG